MDFLTHTFIGVGAARLITPAEEWRPQLCLPGILGSLLMDADSLIVLNGFNSYGLYHRVASHSVIGLCGVAVIVTALSFAITAVPAWRRFGWFVHANLPRGDQPLTRAPWRAIVMVTVTAVVLHWCADVISGFGNMEPLWPWNRWEASLRAVTSFDWFIFSTTLAWYVTARRLNWPRRREAVLAALWFILIGGYVTARHWFGSPQVW